MAGRRWEIVWSHAGLWALRRIPWRDACDVDAAVLRFAATGEGALERISDDPVGAVLAAPPYSIRLTLDPIDQLCTVWRIYRRR